MGLEIVICKHSNPLVVHIEVVVVLGSGAEGGRQAHWG